MPNVVSRFKSVDYIITAKNYGGSVENYIKIQQENIRRAKGIVIKFGDKVSKHAVKARIWQGQWIADCECKSASFVDPDNPVFACFGCGNREDDGNLREVIFPSKTEREAIEKLLLARPVDDRAGLDDRERAGLAKPLIYVEGKGGLARDWIPGESIPDLLEQNEAVEKWNKALRK